MSRKYQQSNTSLCFEDLSFMKEGEPSRTVDKSCITDPTPHNRLPVAARQHAHLHKECHGPVLRFCSSGVWSVHQCTAVVAKGKLSFLKVCPKDFIFLFIYLNKQHSQCYFCECQRAELQNVQYSTVTGWSLIRSFQGKRWEEIPTVLSADCEDPPETTGLFCLGSHAVLGKAI